MVTGVGGVHGVNAPEIVVKVIKPSPGRVTILNLNTEESTVKDLWSGYDLVWWGNNVSNYQNTNILKQFSDH